MKEMKEMVQAANAVLVVFIICSAADIFAVWKSSKTVQRIFKPLLMPLLMAFFILMSLGRGYLQPTAVMVSPNNFVLLALFFGFLGDTFLLGNGVFFTLGLSSFLIGHVFYILAFLRNFSISRVPAAAWPILAVYVLYSVVICSRLFPFVSAKDKPSVIIYMTALLLMSFTAMAQLCALGEPAAALVFAGSLLFIASDTILSFQQFKKKGLCAGRGAGVVIMLTYAAAQLLITVGMI
jgi:uncharacterized membrane protein YhhN